MGLYLLFKKRFFTTLNFFRMGKNEFDQFTGYQAMFGREQRLKAKREMDRTILGLPRSTTSSAYSPSLSSAASSSREPATNYSATRSDSRDIIQVMIFTMSLTKADLGQGVNTVTV